MKTLPPALLTVPALAAEPDVQTHISGRCATCHGAEGHATSPIFPSLAGRTGATCWRS